MGVARSADLPYVGEAVVNAGRARYVFVFEGALSREDHLSVTVLACLWPLVSKHPIHGMFSTFWPSTFHRIVDSLGINPRIARHSYVVDAVRVASPGGGQDRKLNKELLREEISSLCPEVVAMVGRTAERTVGNVAQRPHGPAYIHVPFPTGRRSQERIASDELRYRELREMLGAEKSR